MTLPATSLGTRARWPVLLLSGPVIWYLHFWLVYLVAEAGCAPARGRPAPESLTWVTVTVLAVTAAAVGLISWLAVRAWQVWRQRNGEADSLIGHLAFIGLLLGLLFAFGTLLVGLSAAVLPPC